MGPQVPSPDLELLQGCVRMPSPWPFSWTRMPGIWGSL